VLLLVAILALAILGAGAIALERPVGQAEGQVLAVGTNKPLADAQVTVSGPVTRTAVSGPDGRYRFNNLPVGAYAIAARADRYDMQWHEGEVTVAEGKVAGGLDFKLARTLPSLEVASTQRVFLPGEATRIGMRGTQVPHLDVTVYRVDLGRALGKLDDAEPLRAGEIAKLKARGLLSPVKTWTQDVRAEEISEDHWFYKPIQMPELPIGAYLLSVGGDPEKAPEDLKAHPRLERAFWFNVTNLALVTKRAEAQMLVYAVDLVNKKPVPGARVRLLGKNGALGAVTTDAKGLAWLPATASAGTVLAVGDAKGAPAVARAWVQGPPSPYRIYAYSERPVYRPGQRVFFKAIARADKQARYTPAAGAGARVVVKDSTGTEIMDQAFTLDAASALAGHVDLPAEAALGEYNAEISIGTEAYETLRFQVAEYRKPEFKVEITPAQPRYRQGETATVNMVASYYFGAPVPGAKLNVTVYAAPLYDQMGADESFYAGYTSEPGVEPFWGFGDVVHQTEAVTDGEGRVRIQVPVAKPDAEGDPEAWVGDRAYTVSVEAMDASNRPVKATQSFRVTQGDFRVSVEADQSLYTGEDGMNLTVRAQDYEDRPVKTRVELQVLRLVYEDKKTAEGDEYVDTRRETAWTGSAETGADGRARVSVPALAEGSYVVEAKATDARGNQILDQAWTWIAGEQWAGGSYRHGALQLVMDKKVYRPGDVAKVLVVSPVPGVSALVTVEGVKLHSARVVTMTGASALVSIPVTEAFKPNAFVAASVVNGKEFMQAEKSLNVLPEEQFLKVAVTSDKRQYQPGEKATFKVETRDHLGRPVSADVSLGVVDQAVYAIEPDHTPDIRGYFHGPRWNTISTDYSFAEDYSGGLDKFAPDPRVRARFEDTAAWYPSLRTDASGVATVTFTLPDNLTTWVATARAATAKTQVGAIAYNVVATKELLVRLETPRFVVMGDHVEISAIAHNYTDQAQRVSLRLETEGLDLRTPAAQERSLGAGDAQRVVWEADVPATGMVKARVIARGQTAADAMELPMPALAYGVEELAAFAGAAKPDSPGQTTVTLQPGALPPTVELVLRPHTTPLPAILSAVDYLHDFEYGCVEQTMSRFLPDMAIPRRLAVVGAPAGDRFAGSSERAKDGVRRLLSMQHGDGGWGWWNHDESKVEMTGYVLYGLAEARRAGANVPDAAVNRAIDYLKRQLPTIKKDVFTRQTVERNAGADLRALALFGLAQWRQAPDAEINRLWADRAALSHYGTAQLALVLAEKGDMRRFEALDTLEKAVLETETQASWPSTAAAYSWQDNATEATAYALRAYLAISPEAPTVVKVVRWLESKNVQGYWESTKDTGAAAIALADYIAVRKPDPAPAGLRVRVNDQEVATVGPSVGDPWAPLAPITLGADRLQNGPNVVFVEADGAGVDYTGTLRYVRQADNLPAAPLEGLKVERTYFHLPADVYARAKGEGSFANFYDDKLVATLPKLGSSVKAGERVLVRVTLTATQGYRYMVAEDPLPAGCEVLEDQPPNWGYWWDHQEYRDEKAAFFFNRLEPGTKTLYYVMRPTTQGRFRVLPPRVWAMYTPELRARGAADTLTITE
jgi:uncharacterized protein YfaS (alpha-2-macroglobulin family)